MELFLVGLCFFSVSPFASSPSLPPYPSTQKSGICMPDACSEEVLKTQVRHSLPPSLPFLPPSF